MTDVAAPAQTCAIVTDIPASHPRVPYFQRMLRALAGTGMPWQLVCDGAAYPGVRSLQAVESGAACMAWINASHLERIAPELALLNLPFGPGDEAMAQRERVDALLALADAASRPQGLRILGLMRGADQLFVAPARHVQRVDDLRGLRVRVAGPGMYEQLLQALGARPVVLPIPHIPDAFAADRVDCVFTSPGGWQTQFGASAPCATRVPGLMFINYYLVARSDWFEGLPPEAAARIESAAQRHVSGAWAAMRHDDEHVVAQAAAAGATVRDALDLPAWRRAVEPLRQQALAASPGFARRWQAATGG